jgi:hypothetical protein
LRIRQRLPKLAGRRADVGDVDEAASVGWVHGVLRMGGIGLPRTWRITSAYTATLRYISLYTGLINIIHRGWHASTEKKTP